VARSKEKALGKGLAALIRDSKLAEGGGQGRLREMPVTDIAVSRRQPRRTFAADELQELAESVRHLGLVQPVVVRPLAGDGAGGSLAADGPSSSSSPASAVCGPPRWPVCRLCRRSYALPTTRPRSR